MTTAKEISRRLGKISFPQTQELIVDGLNFEESRFLRHRQCYKFRKELIQTHPGYQYTVNHIKYLGSSILLKYSKSDDGISNQQNMLFMAALFDVDRQTVDQEHDLESFGNALSDFSTSDQKYLCIIASLDGKHWVVLFFRKQDKKLLLLYFDPLGKDLSPALNFMIERYVRADISTHIESYKTDVSDITSVDTCPICLRYFEMVVSELYKPHQDFIFSLQQKSRFQVLKEMNLLPYQRPKELLVIKKRFQALRYQQIVISNFAQVVHDCPFIEFYEFKEELSKYLENLNNIQKVEQCVNDYLRKLKESLRFEGSSEYKNNEFLQRMIREGEKEICRLHECPLEPIVFTDERFQKLKTGEKNERLTALVFEGFGALSRSIQAKYGYTEESKTQICDIFELKEEICNKLFARKESIEEKVLREEEIKDLTFYLNSLQLPPSAGQNSHTSTELTTNSFEDTLKEFLDKNPETSTGCGSAFTKEATGWKGYEAIYSKSWRDASKECIQARVRETAEKMFQMEVSEAVAVLDRTNQLLTNQRLTISQILTLFAVSNNAGDSGAICKIPDERSRTTTVAMVAAMKIMGGARYVDIVTTSEVLAEEAFQEHAEFYKLLDIMATTNKPDANENSKSHLNRCYSANVVYGSIDTFKHDYLVEIYNKRRRNRGTLILYEAGALMIEHALSMTTLATTVQGMGCLQGMYHQIWTALPSVDKTSAKEIADELHRQKEKVAAAKTKPPEHAHNENANLYRTLETTFYDKIHKDVEHQVKATCMNEVPAHLAELVVSCMDTWIDSAMVARYKLKENVDYYLAPGEATDVVIHPLQEYANNFRMTTFSHGIHQFLELKHNLQPTTQNLAICAISNFGYISLYGSNVLGFTSTLGSKAEQDLMREVYNVNILRIPTLKSKRFREIDGRVISDRNWAKYMAVDANLKAVQDGRAVLIICKTIEDCEKVEYCMKVFDTIRPPKPYKEFEEFCSKFRSINVLTNELETAVAPNDVFPGDAIIATSSIAASLNLTSSKDVDTNGGIHVCLGFCPKTEREKENHFQIARSGNRGSGQILARTSGIQLSHSLTEIKADENKVDVPGDTDHENPSFEKTAGHVGTKLKIISSKSFADGMVDGNETNELIDFFNSGENEMAVLGSEVNGQLGLHRDSGSAAARGLTGIGWKSISSKLNDGELPEWQETGQIITEPFNSCDNAIAPSGSQATEASDKTVPEASTMDPFINNFLHSDFEVYEAEKENYDRTSRPEMITPTIGPLDPQCYKSQLSEIDEQMETAKRKHGQIQAENMEDFAVTRDIIASISQFWTEPSTSSQTENEEIKSAIFKSDQIVMQNLVVSLHELYKLEKLFQQFWSFYLGCSAVPRRPLNKCFPFPQDYLNLWATWIYSRDVSRSEDRSDNVKPKGGNAAKSWKDQQEIAAKSLFNEFKMHMKEKEDEYIRRMSKQNRKQGFPNLSSRELTLQQIATSQSVRLLPSPIHYGPPVAYEPSDLGTLIRKTMLREIELCGSDILNYWRKSQCSGIASDEMRPIAAGVGALSRSKASVVPAALSDASTVGVFLITEGIMNTTLGLLNIEEARRLDASNDPKSQIIIYTLSLLSSQSFEVNLPNVKLLEKAANECFSYAKALTLSQASAFHSFLERLGSLLKRILLAVMKYLQKYNVKGATSEPIHLPLFSQERMNLVEDCRKNVRTLIMNRVEATFEDDVVKDYKLKIRQCVEHCIQQLKEPRYKLESFDEGTFIDACIDTYDDYFLSSYQAQADCADIAEEIRKYCHEIVFASESSNVPGFDEALMWRNISQISKSFLFKLEGYLQCIQVSEDVAMSDVGILLQYASELLTEKIYDTIRNPEKKPGRTHEVDPLLWDMESFQDAPRYPNTKMSLHSDIKHANVVDKYYIGYLTKHDSLLKYQLAYMMDTVRLQRNLEHLDALKESTPISTIEDLNILTKALGCCFEIKCRQTGRIRKVGLDIFGMVALEIENKRGCSREHYNIICQDKFGIARRENVRENELLLKCISGSLDQGTREVISAERLWKHLIQFWEARIKKSVDWHTKTQSTFFRLLHGSLRFPRLRGTEDKGVGWSDMEELDIACEIVVDHSEAKVGDMQELSSILKGNTELQFGHTVKKHSSPKSGLDFLKRYTNVKHLSTFENYERLAEAFAACIRKIRNKAEVLPFIRGTDFEIHLDASQLELANPLRMYEIRRNEKKKPVLVSDKLMVNFITLILGTRHQASLLSLDTRRFFHVQTVVPRSERPQDLADGEPYCIKIRSPASVAYVAEGTKKWDELNRKVYEWKTKQPKLPAE